MRSHHSVIIVGGGHAGLSMSYCLKQRGIEHLVLEKHRVAHAWRNYRWDSFCLVTPNWQCKLPGFPYQGDDPHGFMLKEEVIQYIEDYVASFDPPLKEGVSVSRVHRPEGEDLFELNTSAGDFSADQVVVATSGYNIPSVPRMGERFSHETLQLTPASYKNPQDLPEGGVLVVGTGQSGCQIAEDLHLAGKTVHLCVGGAPRAPRMYRGKDVVEWLEEMGYYNIPIDEHPKKDTVRTKTNHYVTGRDGGREIDLRTFALEGMRLYGRLNSIQDTRITFGDDLAANLDHADSVAESIKKTIDTYIAENGIEAPQEPPYKAPWQPARPVREIDYVQEDIGTVIWCTGFRSDFSWIEVPIFDGKGYPGHQRGVTPQRGFYFLGLQWLYTWGSGRLSGVAKDAEYLADCIGAGSRRIPTRSRHALNEGALGS